MTPEEKARKKVANSKILHKYYDTIFYDWPNWDEHIAWIDISSEDDILDWVTSVNVED